MIRVVCGCGRVFKAEVRHSGKRTRCPACGTTLIIGQTPSSGSGEGELEEVPSWWYPTDPATTGADGARPAGVGDPEAIRTTVLESGLARDGARTDGFQAGGPPVHDAPAAERRSRWTLAGGAIAATAALTLGALAWIWWAMPVSSGTTASRAPRADAGRGPNSGLFSDPTGPPAVDDGFRGTERERLARPARRLRLLVPAYIYPAGDGRLLWRRLMDAAAKVDLLAIVNPDSGPGVERKLDYTAIITEAADRGVKLVGYINTQYAARPASEVKQDVDAWVRFYPRIAGFFLDQQPVDPRHSAYIADITGYAKARLRGATVITNPGFPCDESYLTRGASDLVCVFANFEGFDAFEVPAHLRVHDSSRYAALVYQVADVEAMRSTLKEAIIKRIGYIYVTDGKQPNPWSQLPPYFEAEVDAMARLQ